MSDDSTYFNYLLLTGLIVASMGAFAIDVGFSESAPLVICYPLLVMATYRINRRYSTLAFGVLSTLLIIAGFLLSISSEPIVWSAANRLLSVVVVWGSAWFVSNYKSSLDHIQKSEERISSLFETSTAGILISDINGDIVMLNQKAEEIFGYRREELIGEKIELLVPSQYKSKHKNHRHTYYKNPEPRTMGRGRDLYGLKKNGKEFPLEISLNYFETNKGTFVISYMIDITQRKEAEDNLLKTHQELKQKAVELKQAQELAHIGNYEMNLSTGEVSWSDETFRIFEMEPEGQAPEYENLKMMILPEYRDDIDDVIDKVRREGERHYLELGIITLSGETRYLYSIVDPVKNEQGEVVKIFGTTQDITDRKKAEIQYKENERRYRMLFQGTTDEILVWQLDEHMEPLPFMEVNDTACDILGYHRDDLLQQTIYDIVEANKKEIQKRIKEVFKQGEHVFESQHITKEGNTIPLEVSVRSFIYDDQPTIISIGRDIRERLKLEEKILNISEQERRRIGRDMHDDLGQMLTGIGLIAQNITEKLRSEEHQEASKMQEIAGMIKEADNHARALVRGLVPINIESNGLEPALDELVRRSSKIYNIELQFSNESTYVDQKDHSFMVHLYRIAQEAINNAIKHGDPSTIDVELVSSDSHLRLRIADDGCGFSESKDTGNGMGLRIMNFRAQMIGGNIEINTQSHEGTEIICTVPVEH